MVKRLNERETSKLSPEDIIHMAAFVLKNNFFWSNGEVKRQNLGTAIGTKFELSNASIFINKVVMEVFKSIKL